MKKIYRMLAITAFASLLLGGPVPARAESFMQGDDPMIYLPQMLIIIDSSCSMNWGNYSGRNRIQATREVLVGVPTCPDNSDTGILDSYNDLVHFGFATFDTSWSDWDYPTDGDGVGHYGIKNRAAGNGPLIDLVKLDDPLDLIGHAQEVNTAICNMNASGGTPLGPALHDAKLYWEGWRDADEADLPDPMDKCYPKFTCLMSDGQGNTGEWVYGHGWDTALDLWDADVYNPGIRRLFNPFYQDKLKGIPTFMVGFGDASLQLELDAIALSGSGGLLLAFMADDPSTLYDQFAAVLAAILSGEASRTEVIGMPSRTTTDASYMYAAYFEVPRESPFWRGHIVRIKMIRVEDPPNSGIYVSEVSSDLDEPDWIYFENHLRNQDPTDDSSLFEDRRIMTVIEDPRSQIHDPGRPFDQSGGDPGAMYPFIRDKDASDPWMCIQDTGEDVGVVAPPGDPARLEAIGDLIKDFIRGVPDTPSANGSYTTPAKPALGDVFHSSPVVVPPPTSLGPDFRYDSYFTRYKDRLTMLYVGANDGMLHAFVAEDPEGEGTDKVGTELWAFIPNNLLPKLQRARYTHENFVDGTPVVKDVLFRNKPCIDGNGDVMKDADGNDMTGAYRTVLVAGERKGGDAYFALDVSDPENPEYLWEFRTGVGTSADYADVQCQRSVMQTFAKPIVGNVWLKNNEGDPDYFSRSVAIFPGGYIPPQAFMNVTSCVDLAKMLRGGSSLYVVDMETGKLLKEFPFSPSHDDAQAILDSYYSDLAADPDGKWNHWGGWSGTGWTCGEKRPLITEQMEVPPALDHPDNCTVYEDDTVYEKTCCYNPGTSAHGSGCDIGGLTTCAYRYRKLKGVPGGLEVMLKLEGCHEVCNPDQGCMPVDEDARGRFGLEIDDDMMIESVAATPAAYDTSLTKFITRVFVGTTTGKVFRISFNNGEYFALEDEGDMVKPYGTGDKFAWDVDRDGDDPKPWFDTGTGQPIMVSPDLALNYKRNLVLFFGTGRTDTLEYSDEIFKFYAVEETRSIDDDVLVTNDEGELFGDISSNPIEFDEGERLYGKPLVMGGKVIFTSFEPSVAECDTGKGYVYMLRYDDFDPANCEPDECLWKEDFGQSEIMPPPQPIWTPTGPQVVIQAGTNVISLPENEAIAPAARVLHWGKVL